MTRTAAFGRILVVLIIVGLMPAAAWGLTLSISSPPTVTGTMSSVKTQTPGVLSISTQIHCTIVSGESFPSSVNLLYSLKRSGAVVTSASDSPSGLRLQWIGLPTSKSATVTYLLQLPDFGAAATQMKTGQYTVNLNLQTGFAIIPTFVNSESSPFDYTVFSGNLWFKNNLAQLTSLTSEPPDEYVCSADFNLTAYSGSWNNGFAAPSFTQAGNSILCVTNLGTPDGYSTDLDVDSGQVSLPSVTGNTGGIYWILGYPTPGVTLSSAGVTFANAVAVLPASVTNHNLVNGQIWPAGFSGMPFSGGSFFGPLNNVTLSLSGSSYLHGENLPFYVAAQGASFPLGGSAISLTNPQPVYVHQAAEAGLAVFDSRKAYGFPSNDILYRNAGSTAGNALAISQNGMNGTLAFSSTAGNSSFPFAYLAPSPFTLSLVDNNISTNSVMAGTVGFGMQFDPNCTEADCGDAMDNRGTSFSSTGAAIFTNGALAGQFTEIKDISWGGYDGTNATFKRDDTGRTGVWLVPGFIMPGTAATETVAADLRISQILLGSFTFLDTGVMEPDAIHPLHDLTDWSAKYGDGFFAGINLGPEFLIGPYSGTPTITVGQGELLGKDINLRFNGNTSFTAMSDRPFTKYFYRPGGLTGVFNTAFGARTGGTVYIYGYGIDFDRFAFRQDRNVLSSKTFIDGSLTIQEGPVGGGSGKPGLRVGFADLDLTCNGNLGNGNVDTEPEPGWPIKEQAANKFCDGQQGDEDANIDEGCQILDYWNMPILLAGMSFEQASADTGLPADCNTLPKELELMTRNVVDGIGTPLTMTAHYQPVGTLTDQQLSGTVDTWFDRSIGLDKPGFSLRLQNAYLNQVADPANPPDNGGLGGFSVLSGLTDVPLFNDVSVAGHFSNRDATLTDDYAISIFADETELDTDFDGVPNEPDRSYGTVLEYRTLSQSADGLPKPYFSYSWPSAGFIDLSYYAGYNRAIAADLPNTPGSMPQFLGVKKLPDIAEVIDVFSVPDFINPERTKFSFGASAQVPALKNIQFDVGSMDLNDLNAFLKSIGVKGGDADAITNSLEGLGSAEQWMHDLTGGDLTPLLRQTIETELQKYIGTDIDEMVLALNTAQQVPTVLSARITGPLLNLKTEMLTRLLPPEVDLADLYNRLAPFTYYNAFDINDNTIREQLLTQFLAAAPGNTTEDFNAMLADFSKIKTALHEVQVLLNQLQAEKAAITGFVDGTAAESITQLRGYITDAHGRTTDLWNAVSQDMGSIIGSTPEDNVLLGELDFASGKVQEARDAIESVHLGEIADYLFLATLLAGAPLDTSLIREAEATMLSALDQVDGVINSANSNMASLYGSIEPISIFQQVEAVIGDGGLVHDNLDLIDAELVTISTSVPLILGMMENSVTLLQEHLIAGLLVTPANNIVPGSTWVDIVKYGQDYLDLITSDFANNYSALGPFPLLDPVLTQIGSSSFPVLFSRDNLALIITAPIEEALKFGSELTGPIIPGAIGTLQGYVESLLPHPTSADIKQMISGAIVNSDTVQSLNTLFFEQVGGISDVIDDIATQLSMHINTLIKETIAAVDKGLSESLNEVTSTLGFDGASSAGINGFAIVSQDEIERIHLEAEFSFGGDPDPTSYNAALDVATWNSINGESGKGDNVCLTEASAGNIDVTISTHDVPADMLGTSVGIKEAVLGFSMGVRENPVYAYPLGVFGRLYTSGSMDFEALTLEDLGLESALGVYELYFGATGSARFQDFNIPKAAFYLGTSCTNEVLERLDPEVADFIGDLSPLTGAYVRGSVEVPIYNNGCALTAGVGADIGAWYFTDPSPGTYGGLLGGSAYGQLACLASLKGSITAIGQKSGTEYKFAGSGWAAAGVGSCSPSKWKKISHSRKDDWCLTGDASFDATFSSGDWSVTGPDVSCCH